MRTISIRQFQQNFHKELKDVPFVISRRRIPVFVLTTITDNNNVVTIKPKVNKPAVMPKPKQPPKVPKTIREEKPSSFKKCPHGVLLGIGYCQKGCKM